jgi:carbonic anhydrase/acetyltransferase-like protein (isoleucine patch superfamily)
MNHKALILPYKNTYPKISETAFVAPNVSIIGDVEIGDDSGIWFGTVVRGDVAKIRIGKSTNIQDGSVIHVTRNGFDTIIGDNVTIGHKVLIHAAKLHDYSFIGMGSVIMDNAIVESFSWVAAGSLVTNGKIIKTGEIWAGSPAKFFRKLTDEETSHIKKSADNYALHVKEYKEILK